MGDGSICRGGHYEWRKGKEYCVCKVPCVGYALLGWFYMCMTACMCGAACMCGRKRTMNVRVDYVYVGRLFVCGTGSCARGFSCVWDKMDLRTIYTYLRESTYAHECVPVRV